VYEWQWEQPAALALDVVQQHYLKTKNNNEATSAAAETTCSDTDADGLRESVHVIRIPGPRKTGGRVFHVRIRQVYLGAILR
jgi:hypothetical protein